MNNDGFITWDAWLIYICAVQLKSYFSTSPLLVFVQSLI